MKPRKGLNSFNDHFQWLDVKMPVRRQSEGFLEVAKDLELLCIEEEVYDLDKGTVRKESRWVEESKRNFGDGKLLLISRGQAYIPYKNGDVQNFYTWSN